MSKIEIIENIKYYPLNVSFEKNRDLYFFDAVKKVLRVYNFFEFFWVTCIGGIFMNHLDESISFTNVSSFYIHNYFDEVRRDILVNLAKKNLDFDFVAHDRKALENYFESNFKINKDYIFGIYSRISDFDRFEVNDFVESYTNKFMLYLEALIVFNFAKNLLETNLFKRGTVFVSDGSLSKFANFLNRYNDIFKDFIWIGVIKDIKRNYLAELESDYLYKIPYFYRSSAFRIKYDSFEVLSFYLNIGRIIRVEVLGEFWNELLNIANFIVSLSNLPSLYYRMPTNNIVFTKLERNLKNYITSDLLFLIFD